MTALPLRFAQRTLGGKNEVFTSADRIDLRAAMSRMNDAELEEMAKPSSWLGAWFHVPDLDSSWNVDWIRKTAGELVKESRGLVMGAEEKTVRINVGDGGDDEWKHRSIGMRCRTCMFYVAKRPLEVPVEGTKAELGLGRCRRHAPTMNGWPVMKPLDWCGDHKLDEEKI